MSRETLLLRVMYSQYILEEADGELGEAPFAGGNGLIWVDPKGGAAVVMTGLDNGALPVTVEVLDHEPPPELQAWDDVVEVSMTITGDGFTLYGPPFLERAQGVSLPAAPGQTRSYRLRVHALGRDRGREVFSVDTQAGEETVETHQILLWPAPHAPDTHWKLTDNVGAEIRAAT